MFEGVAPGTLKIWLMVAAALYLLLPYDLIPDFLGLPGRIDDFAVMAWLAWLYRSRLAGPGEEGAPGAAGSGSDARDSRRSGRSQRAEHSHHGPRPKGSKGGPHPGTSHAWTPDAYTVLGVPPSASPQEIRAAYRARMQEYHPDKVAHLGAELQQLALEKSQQIQRAYHQLQKAGPSSDGSAGGARGARSG